MLVSRQKHLETLHYPFQIISICRLYLLRIYQVSLGYNNMQPPRETRLLPYLKFNTSTVAFIPHLRKYSLAMEILLCTTFIPGDSLSLYLIKSQNSNSWYTHVHQIFYTQSKSPLGRNDASANTFYKMWDK